MPWPFASFIGGLFGGSGLPRIDAPTGGTLGSDAAISLANPIGSVVRACMDRILSRACYVEFDADDDLPNMPCGPANARSFYWQVIEQMLVEGYAVAYPATRRDAVPGGRREYRVAVSAGSTLSHGDVQRAMGYSRDAAGRSGRTWTLRTAIIEPANLITVPVEDCIFFTYRQQHGTEPYQPESPLFEIGDALTQYERARAQWIDYAHRGSKLAYVIQGNREVQNPDSRKNIVDEIRDFLNQQQRSYGVITLPIEAQMAQLGQPTPPVKEAMLLATQEIARFFGVPLQLLQTEVAPEGAEELAESKLLADAVFPICERIAQAWEMKLGKKVMYRPMRLSRPTLGARAGYIKSLAGSGCLTIDENRALIDYAPLPDGKGKLMPSPQGGSTQGLAEEERKGAPNKSGANRE